MADALAMQLKQVDKKDQRQAAQQYFKEIERWLDAHHGDAWLRDRGAADYVVETIRCYERAGYWHVMAYAVMPNHLHLFFRCGTLSLSDVMRRFKRCTGREANQRLGRVGQRFWQREWFDHWSRSAQEDDKIVAYIRNNPVRAGLAARPEDWPWAG